MSEKRPGCGNCQQRTFAGIKLPSFGADSYTYQSRPATVVTTTTNPQISTTAASSVNHSDLAAAVNAANNAATKYTLIMPKMRDIQGSAPVYRVINYK